MALADFTADVQRIAEAEVFGVARPEADGRVHFVTRHRAGITAHLFPGELLPSLLRPGDARRSDAMEREGFSRASLSFVAPLSEHPEAAHPIVSRLLTYGVAALAVVPLRGVDGFFWVGRGGVDPLPAAQADALAELAGRVSAALQAPEPAAARLDRLA